MDGWVQVTSSVYVRPVDWEDFYVIKPARDGVKYEAWKYTVGGEGPRIVCAAPTPALCAKGVDGG